MRRINGGSDDAESSIQRNWDFKANTSSELANIGRALLKGSKQKFLDEQVQMTRLLEAWSIKTDFQFPVRVRHTGEDSVPDFQLEFGPRRITAELSKIAVQDVEHARGIQRNGRNRTLAISSLYRKGPAARSKDDVIAESLLMPAITRPVSLKEYAQRWDDEAVVQLERKTAVLRRDNFQHGDEDWLVLWDRIGNADWEVDDRIRWFARLLSSIWHPGWYAKVILQEEHFSWQAVFAEQETFVLRPKN